MDINNFWNNHTLNDFQQLAILKNVHSLRINSLCFLKDGRIVSSSFDRYILIYNKNTFKIDIRIREKINIIYMNINKDGILITCLDGISLHLYEIKGKRYSIIQTIKPYNFFFNIIGKISDICSINKYVELKKGDIAILLSGHSLCFYRKKENSKQYSYLSKFNEKFNEDISDLCELDDKQYCLFFKLEKLIKFLDWNKKKITHTIKIKNNNDPFSTISPKNQLLLINERDLFVVGEKHISIIDIKNKEIIKNIFLHLSGYLSYMYKLSENIILAGFWNKYIGQLEYDDIKKELKFISNIGQEYSSSSRDLYNVTSIIFNNSLIVSSYDEDFISSLIIYQLKTK